MAQSRDKINRIHIAKYSSHQNDVYRYFRSVFQPMLSSENPANSAIYAEDWYIQNHPLHEEMDAILEVNLNHRIMIVGHTGIGKSSFIRNYFGHTSNPQIKNDILFIPFYFDPISLNGSVPSFNLIQPRIEAACSLVMRKYDIKYSDELLYKFIDGHRSDLLHPTGLKFDATIVEKIAFLRENRPYEYTSELLKFFGATSPVKKVVLIIDDIDTVEPIYVQGDIVTDAARFTYHLQEIYQDKEEEFHIEHDDSFQTVLIVSCRPNTYTNFKASEVLNGMPFEKPINIDQPVELTEIFKIRFEAALRDPQISKQIQSRETFAECKEILIDTVDAISEIGKDFLVGINNFNVRSTLRSLQEVISNRRYIQQGDIPKSQFVVNRRHFKISNANVIRAIGLGESDVYNPKSSPIKNIFSNNRYSESDLIGIYLFNILVRGALIEPSKVSDVSISFDELNKSMHRLFNREEQSDTIARRIKEYEDWELIKTEKVNSENNQMIHLTPRGAVLWNEIRERSFLIEFFRDDMYLPTSSEDEHVWPLILRPVEELEPEDRFGSALRLIDSYAAKEWRLFARKKEEEELGWLREVVDGNCVSSMMLSGVKSSIGRYYRNSFSGIPNNLKEARQKVQDSVDKTRSHLRGEIAGS